METRKNQEVNAGSMADIAFLLLIFFLVSTTMDADKGLGTILPPYQDEPIDNKPKNERNVFEILVNANNKVMVEKKEMDISHLTDATKEFIINPYNNPDLSDKETKRIKFFGTIEVSKGIISLQTANETEYQTYLMVQNEIVRAFNEMREVIAKKQFGKPYSKLKEDEKRAVRTACPKIISEAEPVKIASR